MIRLLSGKTVYSRLLYLIITTATLGSLSIKHAYAGCAVDPRNGQGYATGISSLVDPSIGDQPNNTWGEEGGRYHGTCDGDGEYRGYVRDLYTDGRYVQVRLSTERSMRREWIQTYTGSSWRNYRSWGRGTYYMRICKSGTPIGVSEGDSRCSYTISHYGF